MATDPMRIWIDLANTPQVLVLKPVVDALRQADHEVVVTMRDFAQTVEVAAQLGVDGVVLDHKPSKASRLRTAYSLARRVRDLEGFARQRRFDVAMSHNSYAQIVAARLAGLRVVTMMDYEGQPANHGAFRLAHRVVVPEAFPADALRRFGAREAKVTRFPGFKEQLYLDDFTPSDLTAELEAACGPSLRPGWTERVLVVVRPPASTALYHRFENTLFPRLLRRLDVDHVQVVALPRTPSQTELFTGQLRSVAIPHTALDGPSLVSRADLVISAGGTMNREAAVLGTPAYTMFAGELPAVDAELIEMGRLDTLLSEEAIDAVPLNRKVPLPPLEGNRILEVVLDAIVSAGQARSGRRSDGAALFGRDGPIPPR